jgi:hypothetical protein
MAFFTLYLDVSGQAYDSPFVVMAGYVAPTAQWESFVDEWAKVIKRENITVWHMADFHVKRGEYKGWEQARGDKVYEELSGIIREHISVAIVSAVEVKPYGEFVSGRELRRHFGGPYKFCFLSCIAQVKRWAEREAISERVAYVLERGDAGQKEVRRTLDRFFNDEASCEQWKLGALTTLEKKDPCAIPCQAGDILAWECRREVVERRKTNPRSPRLSLERLLVPSDSDVVWDRNTLPLLIDPLKEEKH